MNGRVRRAVVEGAAAIAAIYNEAIAERIATFESDPRTADEIRAWILQRGPRHPVLVLEVDHRVAGWAAISPYRPRACYDGVGEFSIYLGRPYRGRGLGKHLLEALVGEAAGLGYWKLVSRIFDFNHASRALCRSCGFREVGIYRNHAKLDGRWIDCVIVERLIPDNIH